MSVCVSHLRARCHGVHGPGTKTLIARSGLGESVGRRCHQLFPVSRLRARGARGPRASEHRSVAGGSRSGSPPFATTSPSASRSSGCSPRGAPSRARRGAPRAALARRETGCRRRGAPSRLRGGRRRARRGPAEVSRHLRRTAWRARVVSACAQAREGSRRRGPTTATSACAFGRRSFASADRVSRAAALGVKPSS